MDEPWVRALCSRVRDTHLHTCIPPPLQVSPSLPPIGSDGLRYNITRSMRGSHAFANIRGAQRFCSVVGSRSFIGVDTCRADALLMHELLGSEEVRQWLKWEGSKQGLLHSSELGKLLQVRLGCLVLSSPPSLPHTSPSSLLSPSHSPLNPFHRNPHPSSSHSTSLCTYPAQSPWITPT